MDPTRDLMERAARGDRDAQGTLLEQYRARLRRMVEIRLDLRLRDRVAASDIVQDAFLDAARRLQEYLREPSMPFLVWLRFLTAQQIAANHRHHLGVQGRDVRREERLEQRIRPAADASSLAQEVLARSGTPSQAAVREEARQQVSEALAGMDPIDREVLCLRHFEQLTNAEVAAELEIESSAASKRYLRALARLQEILRPRFGAGITS